MPEIKDSQLASPIAKDLADLAVGYVRFAAATNVADTITVGAAEVWTASAGGAGAREYDQSGGTAAACATSLAAKINGDATSQVRAVRSGDTVLLFAKLASAGNLALAEDTAGARTVVSAAAMVGSKAAAVTSRSIVEYALTAADVTTMAPAPGVAQEIVVGAFASTTQPKLLGHSFRTAAGDFYSPATLRLVFEQQGANEWVLKLSERGAVAVLAATDIVTCEVGF